MFYFEELEQNKFHIMVSDLTECKMHGHEFLELAYVVEGTIEHCYDNEQSVVNQGEYFIVDHGNVHSYRQISKTPVRIINVLFYPEFLEQTLLERKSFDSILNTYLLRFSYKTLESSPTGKAFEDQSQNVLHIINNIKNEYDKKRYGYLEYIRCLLVEILITTMRKIGKKEKTSEKSDIVLNIINYINEHYKEKIHLSDLTEKYNYSLSHISRKFKQETGLGFSDYLQRVRIEQSCRLLESSNLLINEIASEVGYEDMKFFNKTFKQILKCSPREFRKINENSRYI